MQHKVEICGVNTAKLKVLKNEETQALLLRAKAGDAQARDELIAGNLRLVLSVIQRFANRGENLDDLFQVGCIGLIKAIDNFNTDLDVRFSTYGVPMILGEVGDICGTTAPCGCPGPCGTRPIRFSRPRMPLWLNTSGNPPWMRSPPFWVSAGRTSSLPWMPL